MEHEVSAIRLQWAVLCVGGAVSIAQLTSTPIPITYKPRQLDEARRSLEMIAQQWDQALGRLKRAVEMD